jgi:hypothetical protein
MHFWEFPFEKPSIEWPAEMPVFPRVQKFGNILPPLRYFKFPFGDLPSVPIGTLKRNLSGRSHWGELCKTQADRHGTEGGF